MSDSNFLSDYVFNSTNGSGLIVALTSFGSAMVLNNGGFGSNLAHGITNGLAYVGSDYLVKSISPDSNDMGSLLTAASTGAGYLVLTKLPISYFHDGRSMSDKFIFSSLNALAGKAFVEPMYNSYIAPSLKV